jgi:hypothetical protein
MNWLKNPQVVIWKLYHPIWRSPPKTWKMDHLTWRRANLLQLQLGGALACIIISLKEKYKQQKLLSSAAEITSYGPI